MAGRQAPTSVVQNVISALVEDPAHLQRAAAATAAAEPDILDAAAQALAAAGDAEVEARLDADELLKQAEEQAGDQFQGLLDSKSLKRLVTSFDRKYKENLEMRTRYADQPEKFMESEVDLDEEVKKLMAIAGTPELYPDLIRTNTIQTLLALLVHQNTDIVADVIGVFEDLTDADVIEDSEEEALQLVNHMLELDALPQLVYRLRQFNEAVPEEAEATQKLLSVFENLIEVKPEVAEQLVQLGDNKTGFLRWMLDRLKNVKEFEGNKQYVSELLSILMQSSTANQIKLATTNGIDALLSCVFPYKGRNARSDGEEEYVANLFGCLCSCLMPAENKVKFMQAEGLELMQLILKEKRVARAGALRVVDFATTRNPPACERWVDLTGLKQLFAIFMGKSKMKHKKGADNMEQEEEEHTVSVISNLFQGLSKGSRRDRVAAKFVESEFEKCDRLMELYNRYLTRVVAAQAELQQATEEEDLTSDEVLLRRMDAGLYTLQQCALIIGNLWIVGDQLVKQRILMLLHQQSNTMSEVRDVLREVRLTIGDEGDSGDRERQQARVKRMLVAMGVSEEDLDNELKEYKQDQEAAAAALPTELQAINGDAHSGIPRDEAVEVPNRDVDMEVEGTADVDMDVEDTRSNQHVVEEEDLPPLPTAEEQPPVAYNRKHKRKRHEHDEAPDSSAAAHIHDADPDAAPLPADSQGNHEAAREQHRKHDRKRQDRTADVGGGEEEQQRRSEHKHRDKDKDPAEPKRRHGERSKDGDVQHKESSRHRDRESSKRRRDEDRGDKHHSRRDPDKGKEDNGHHSSRRHRDADDREHRSKR